jgi:hypothetical protein
MFNIFKRSQNQIVSQMVKRIEEANSAPQAPFKIELLLATRENSKEMLKKVERAQGDIALGTVITTFGGMGLAIAGFGALLASPLFIAGLAVMALGAGTMYGLGKATDALRADRDAIDAKIMQDVKKISVAEPEEAKKSTRFNREMAAVFNTAADAKAEEAYAKVSARYAPKAPALAA